MTLQIWGLRPDRAVIVCDTVATHMATNRPMAFMAKAFCIPHRSLMIAALGWAYPAQTVFSHLSLGFGPDHDADLPAYAAELMRAASAAYPEPQDWHRRTLVAMFIWDEAANEIVGWRFEGQDQYAYERMEPDGEPFINPPTIASVEGLDWYAVAHQQQAEDRNIPAFDRDNIGGSVVAYEMATNPHRPPTITMTNYGRLPYFEEQAADVKQTMEELAITPMQIMQAK